MALQDFEPSSMAPIGDAEADAELEAGIARLTPFLRAFAMSLSRNYELAEDIAQDTLLKAWAARRSYTPGSNLKAWLFTILRNEFYSLQRRAWRHVEWDESLTDSIPTARDQQVWALDLSDMASAMQALPEEQRKALLLVGAGGCSYDEAAKHIRASVGTVKSRVARARQRLTKLLDESNAPPVKWRPAAGNAMNEILAQVSQLVRMDGPRSGAGPALL